MEKIKCKCGVVGYEIDADALCKVEWTCEKCGKSNTWTREVKHVSKADKKVEPENKAEPVLV
jgi:hypothetical protein